ncbi:MAG: phage Quesadilla [Actinomycetota bacterium]|jgi:hypothetical protein
MTWAEPQQLALLDDPIDVRFLEFHHANPAVYDRLVELAYEWRAAGHERCSMDMLVHLVRWDYGTRTQSTDGFKINDHYVSRYARLIAANEPQLAPMFTTRALRGDAA